jgi:hypothetical protein
VYRDDMEALKARVETLELATQAERKAREAAVAAEKAATARADELALLLERSSDDPDPPFWRRHGLTVLAAVVAIGAVGAVISLRAGQLTDRQRAEELDQQRSKLNNELAVLKRRLFESEAQRESLRRSVSELERKLREQVQEHQTAEATTSGGVLDRAAIQRVVDSHMAQVQRCYETQLLKNPALAGKIVFEWVVGKTGRVASARQISSTLRSSAVASCILAQMRRWRFPAPREGTRSIRYPFVFRSSDSTAQMGRLVAATKPWSRVFVDGKDTGRITPIPPSDPLMLSPGLHRVTFEANGKRFVHTVRIRAGGLTKLVKSLPVK